MVLLLYNDWLIRLVVSDIIIQLFPFCDLSFCVFMFSTKSKLWN